MSDLRLTEDQEKTVREWLERVKAGKESQLTVAVMLPQLSDERYAAMFVDGRWRLMIVSDVNCVPVSGELCGENWLRKAVGDE